MLQDQSDILSLRRVFFFVRFFLLANVVFWVDQLGALLGLLTRLGRLPCRQFQHSQRRLTGPDTRRKKNDDDDRLAKPRDVARLPSFSSLIRRR